MQDLIVQAMQRLEDALHERAIRKLQAEYLREMSRGKTVLAKAIGRDIIHLLETRSETQVARMERAFVRRLDPHARAVYTRATKA